MSDWSRHLLLATSVLVVVGVFRIVKWVKALPRCEKCRSRSLKIQEESIRSEVNEAGSKSYFHETFYLCGNCSHKFKVLKTTWVVPTDDELPPELQKFKKQLGG